MLRKVKTGKDGIITIKDILEGKYYLKEVKEKEGYVLDNRLIELEIKYQENLEVEISNNKIEVKTQPKKVEIKSKKREERILPRTGY